MRADVYTSESPLTIIYLVSLSIQVPQNRGNNALASSSRSSPNKNTTMVPTNPLPPASSSLTTFHNNSSSSNLALGFILTHRILISFFSCIIRIENGNGGSGGDNNHCIHLLLVVPTVDQRLRRMGFYLLIHWGGLFQMRLGIIDNTTMNTMTRTLQMRLMKVLKKKPLGQSLCPGIIQNWYNHFVSPKLRSQARSLLSFCNRVFSGWKSTVSLLSGFSSWTIF